MNRIEDVTNYITECDKEVGEALALELGRQRRNLELIASENIVSPAVMLAMGTVPTNKYAEGYPVSRQWISLDNAIAVFRKLYELAGTDPEKARH